jgi:methionyl aminopeptidase
MIFYKTDEEIELLRLSNQLVSKTLAEIAKIIRAGISTAELDKLAEVFIKDNKARPAFKGYNGFPGSLCVSINEQVVHGIPSDKRIIQEGDIVSVDCGVVLNGYTGDSAYTFAIGDIPSDVRKLLLITKEALYKGIEQAAEGKRMGDIGSAIQNHVHRHGFSVVREMVGHGVGRDLHEDPQVPNYGKSGTGVKLKSGLVIAIEPMINLGKKNINQLKDGWTVVTADKKPSAHFEHSVAVRKDKTDILSTFEFIEEVIRKKL